MSPPSPSPLGFWTPPREWEGQQAFLIGGGPSLRQFDFARLAGKNVIGSNDAFHLGSSVVRYGCFGDAAWFYRNKLDMIKSGIPFVTCAPLCAGIRNYQGTLHCMSRQLVGIHTGNEIGWNQSTGALAINLAISLGAITVFLLGYDLTNTPAGQSHWHDHNKQLIKEYSFQRFTRGFQSVKVSLPAGVEVINVTDGSSRLQVFTRITFAEFWQRVERANSVIEYALA